jgi:hypothetical protein
MNNKLHKALIFSSICCALSIYHTNTAGAYVSTMMEVGKKITEEAERIAKAIEKTRKNQNSDCINLCDSNQSVQSAIDQFAADTAKQGSLTAGKTPAEIQADIQDLARSTAAVGEAYKTCTNACAGAPGAVGKSTAEPEKGNN